MKSPFNAFSQVTFAAAAMLVAAALFADSAADEATPVAKVAGLAVQPKAYRYFLDEARSEVVAELSREHGQGLTDADFWQREVDGIKPADRVKEKALTKATTYYALLAQAVELGLEHPEREPFHGDNMSDKRRNRTPYGPATLSEPMVVSAFTAGLTDAIKARLVPANSLAAGEAKAYYAQNATRFRRRDGIVIRKIYVSYTSETRAEKVARLEDLLRQLNNGADFAELERRHSEKFRENGWVSHTAEGLQVIRNRKQEDAFLLKTFLDMSEGEVRGVADNQKGGLYLVRCERVGERVTPFEQAMPNIIQLLADEKYAALARDFAASARVEINRAIYDAIRIH